MKTLVQEIKFNTAPEKLYDIYLDSEKHSLAIGAKTQMSRKKGGAFTAHDGYIRGRNLMLVPGKMIVQSWRATDWESKDGESILILAFEKAAGGAVITMVHANVPDGHAALLEKGWKDYYWKPWKKYLAGLK